MKHRSSADDADYAESEFETARRKIPTSSKPVSENMARPVLTYPAEMLALDEMNEELRGDCGPQSGFARLAAGAGGKER
jgi:hypothetical protein